MMASTHASLGKTELHGFPCLWLPEYPEDQKDVRVGFRGQIRGETGLAEIRISGAGWFNLWVDGIFLGDGPTRYPETAPEYQVFKIPPGSTTIAVEVQDIGEGTQRHPVSKPFLACIVTEDGKRRDVSWKCLRLPGWRSGAMRIGPGHAYADWCDLREALTGWNEPGFDDSAWQEPVAVERFMAAWHPPADLGVRQIPATVREIGRGVFAHTYCWGAEEQPLQFFLRELENHRHPIDGVWRRYDIGRVRLGRPDFVIDAPAGSIVEFGYAEHLRQGRVGPFFGYRGGTTCNMDHYVAPGGPQRYFPSVPKGCRFLEVHVFGQPDAIHVIGESYLERVYFGVPEGSFACDDPLLEKIWATGIETLRGCAEDAVTDCPTRERGQYVGDTLSVGMEIGRVAWSDLALFRRALVQAAGSARADGLIAGCFPGWQLYLPTYSLQWISAAVRFHELSGDKDLLVDLFPAAEANLRAFERFWTAGGLQGSQAMDESGMGWIFVDWGYAIGAPDPALNLHYLLGLRSFLTWSQRIGKSAPHTAARADLVESVCRKLIDGMVEAGGWERAGYHCTVLALAANLVEPARIAPAIGFLKTHIGNCFPNNPDAPRVAHIESKSSQVLTPYFFHFAAPVLIRHGEFAFVLEQYRKCWGWMLDQGVTTWMEVFDDRWSHCHHWSGCPTWQLSHFVLGLNRRFDLGANHYQFSFVASPLTRAQGCLPEGISISWERSSAGILYRIETAGPITLHPGPHAPFEGTMEISGTWEILIPADTAL